MHQFGSCQFAVLAAFQFAEHHCAEGKAHYADVVVELSKAKTINGKPTLTYIKVTTKDGKNLPLSDSPDDAWPMELAG